MQNCHFFANAILQLAPLSLSRSLDVLEIAKLLLNCMRVLLAQNKLMLVDLLLNRILYYVVIRAGALSEYLIYFLHVVSHHVEENFYRSTLRSTVRALTSALVLLLAAAFWTNAITGVWRNAIAFWDRWCSALSSHLARRTLFQNKALIWRASTLLRVHERNLLATINLEKACFLFHKQLSFDDRDLFLFNLQIILFQSFCEVLNYILDHNFHFFVLLGIILLRRLASFLDFCLLLSVIFVGFENLHKVEVIWCPSVAINNDKPILQTHRQHSIEKLHVRLLIQVSPAPLVLIEHLSLTGLKTFFTKAEPNLPQLMKRLMYQVSRNRLCSCKEKHLITIIGLLTYLDPFHLLLSLKSLLSLTKSSPHLDIFFRCSRHLQVSDDFLFAITEAMIEIEFLTLLLLLKLSLWQSHQQGRNVLRKTEEWFAFTLISVLIHLWANLLVDWSLMDRVDVLFEILEELKSRARAHLVEAKMALSYVGSDPLQLYQTKTKVLVILVAVVNSLMMWAVVPERTALRA